jgi:predicted deacylase
MVVFEGGEVNRFDSLSIRVAAEGIFRALSKLKMVSIPKDSKKITQREFRHTKWVRAHKSGLFQFTNELGTAVQHREKIGSISNIFGEEVAQVKAPCSGVIVGMATNPKVYQGDAIIHIACD